MPYSARCTNNRLIRWSDILLLQVLKKGYPNLGISNHAIQCKMHKQQTHELVWHKNKIVKVVRFLKPMKKDDYACQLSCTLIAGSTETEASKFKYLKQDAQTTDSWDGLTYSYCRYWRRGILILVYLTMPYSARCTNNRLIRWSDILLLQVLKKAYPNLGISNRAIQCKMHKQQTHEMVWHTLIAGIEGVS